MTTHRIRYLRKMGLDPKESYSLNELAKVSGVPVSILQEVYDRGTGAWKSNPESVRLLSGEKNYSASRKGKMSKEQWSSARVYSFLNKGTTYKTTDSDLAKKANY